MTSKIVIVDAEKVAAEVVTDEPGADALVAWLTGREIEHYRYGRSAEFEPWQYVHQRAA